MLWHNSGGCFTIARNDIWNNLGVDNFDGIQVIDTPYVAVLANVLCDNAPATGKPEGDQIDAGGTNALVSSSRHLIYEGNLVYGRGGWVKMNNEPLYSLIRRNVIVDAGLCFYEGPTKIAMYHNTVVNPRTAVQFWGNGGRESFGGTRVVNNLLDAGRVDGDVVLYLVLAEDRIIITSSAGGRYHLYAYDAADGEGLYSRRISKATMEGPMLASPTNLYVLRGRRPPLVFRRGDGAYAGAIKESYGGGVYAVLTDDSHLIFGHGSRTGWLSLQAAKDRIATIRGANRVVISGPMAYLQQRATLVALDRPRYFAAQRRKAELLYQQRALKDKLKKIDKRNSSPPRLLSF